VTSYGQAEAEILETFSHRDTSRIDPSRARRLSWPSSKQ